jgi:protoporphyrinogen oxidase
MSAALELVKLGAEVTVIEREIRVGGLCGTHERDGFRFDFGGHRFLTQNRDIDRLVRDLLGEDLRERTRSSVILNRGKRYKYPLELDDVVAQFGLLKGTRAIASYGLESVLQRVRPSPDDSFRDWVTHRFGGALYREFFGPYTEKLWGIPPDQISADWAAQRISLPSLSDVMLRLAGTKRPAARTYARHYLYPRLGIGQIFERCREAICARGGIIRSGAEVTGVHSSSRRVRSVRYVEVGREHEIAVDAVISTIALPLLARMLGPMAASLDASTRRLRFRAIRLLNVLLEGPPVSPHTWMYVSEPDYLIARIQEPIHRSPLMAPKGCTSLMLEIPCDVDDATWCAKDDAIYERALLDLDRLGFRDIRARTRDYFCTFVREGYPIYHLGYDSDRRAVLSHVLGFENVSSVGRQGAFRYIFMDTAMEMGIAAARATVSGSQAGAVTEMATAQCLHEAKALTA